MRIFQTLEFFIGILIDQIIVYWTISRREIVCCFYLNTTTCQNARNVQSGALGMKRCETLAYSRWCGCSERKINIPACRLGQADLQGEGKLSVTESCILFARPLIKGGQRSHKQGAQLHHLPGSSNAVMSQPPARSALYFSEFPHVYQPLKLRTLLARWQNATWYTK